MVRKPIGSTGYWLELEPNDGSAFTHTTASQGLNTLFTVHVYNSETGDTEVTNLFEITNNATGEITKVNLDWLNAYTHDNGQYQCQINHNIDLTDALCTGQISSNASESIILQEIYTYTNTQASQEPQTTFNDVLDVLGLDADENNNITNIAGMFANNSAPIEYSTDNTELIINIDNHLYTRKNGTGWQQITSDVSSLAYDKSCDSGGVFLKCTIEKNSNYHPENTMPSGSTWSIDYDYDFEELKDVDKTNYTFYLLIKSTSGKQTITLSGSYSNTYNGQFQDPLDSNDITISIN